MKISPAPSTATPPGPVSYTHLDVYKRQVLIYSIKASPRLIFSDATVFNELRQQLGDTEARAAEAEDHNFLLFQWNSGDVDGGDQRRRCYGRGSLNIVIEGAKLIAVTRQESRRIVAVSYTHLDVYKRQASDRE